MGKTQRTFYLRPDLSRCVDHVAADTGEQLSDVVDAALDFYFNSTLTTEQRKVYRFREKTDGKRGAGKGGTDDAKASGDRGGDASKRRRA